MPERQFSAAQLSADCANNTNRTDTNCTNPYRTGPQPVGRPPKIDQIYLDRLRELATQSPKQFGYNFEHWTAYWLRRHLARELDVTVSERHINRLLRQMGLSRRQRQKSSQCQPNYRHCIEISDLSKASTETTEI